MQTLKLMVGALLAVTVLTLGVSVAAYQKAHSAEIAVERFGKLTAIAVDKETADAFRLAMNGRR